MDVTYVAAPMAGVSEMTHAVVLVVKRVFAPTTLAESQVATTLRPLSMGGTSLNAVAPDHTFERRLAKAGA